MQCSRCQFENLPGQERCFRCGSILGGPALAVEVHPPRMPRWQRPWRRLTRLWNRWNPANVTPTIEASGSSRCLAVAWDALPRLLLSVIPGLGHGRRRRERLVRTALGIWVVAVIAAVLLLPLGRGWLALGTAAAVHAWLALDASVLPKVASFNVRLTTVVLGCVLAIALYGALAWPATRVDPPNQHVTATARAFYGRCPLAVPAQGIEPGDLLRLRPWRGSPPLQAGDLVRVGAATLTTQGRGREQRRWSTVDRVIGQVVAGPGRTVTLHNGVFFVDGQALPVESFPVPQWLRLNDRVQVTVPPEHWFVGLAYQGNVPRNRDVIATICLVESNAIDGRATWLWAPLHRRHRLRPSGIDTQADSTMPSESPTENPARSPMP